MGSIRRKRFSPQHPISECGAYSWRCKSFISPAPSSLALLHLEGSCVVHVLPHLTTTQAGDTLSWGGGLRLHYSQSLAVLPRSAPSSHFLLLGWETGFSPWWWVRLPISTPQMLGSGPQLRGWGSLVSGTFTNLLLFYISFLVFVLGFKRSGVGWGMSCNRTENQIRNRRTLWGLELTCWCQNSSSQTWAIAKWAGKRECFDFGGKFYFPGWKRARRKTIFILALVNLFFF